MKIAFAEFSGWDLHALSVEEKPMGGSQSALCYLARALAVAGHEVLFFSHVPARITRGGVLAIPWSEIEKTPLDELQLDALVCVLAAGRGFSLRGKFAPRTKLIYWTGHDIDQGEVQKLHHPAERAAYDAFVMVSDWQRDRYIKSFGIDPARTVVLRNAIAPAFENLFRDDESILSAKLNPPVLAYTSTPFRGLDLLVDTFPMIRSAVAGTVLRVYSDMGVYQLNAARDQAAFGHLYDRCRNTDGVEYIGSIPQRELAPRLREVTALAYPCSFPETSCIAAMEAMASGCRVVTTNLGALPETTGDFAIRISAEMKRGEFRRRFAEAVIASLRETVDNRSGTESLLCEQVDKINRADTWAMRAHEWEQWLKMLLASAPERPKRAGSIDQLFAEAVGHARQGRLHEANALCCEVLNQHPQHVDALHLLGLICAQIGRTSQALFLFQQTTLLAPAFAEAHNNLGNALAACGRLDDAIASYRKAVALKPQFADAQNNLGRSLQDSGQLAEAIGAYQQAIAIHPQFAKAYLNLATALNADGQRDAALNAYQQAIALDPRLASDDHAAAQFKH